MSTIKITVVLSLLVGTSAFADIWKWVDGNGKTHYVDTLTSIYTWLDEEQNVQYSDTPDHEDAVAVLLVWHSAGKLEETTEPAVDPAEEEARLAAEAEKAYYCKKATENYNAYKGAPRLYRTNDDGEREYLTQSEAKATLKSSKAEMDEYCG